MFFDHYPYTNFHNVNLDWVLQAVKAWGHTVEANDQAFHDLEEANESFKTYVTNYLQDLDVSDEINAKLDDMLASGVLTPYFAPYVQTSVNSWLNSHITPTSPALDNTLTLSGAAARSDTVGRRLKDAAYTGTISQPAEYAMLKREDVVPGYRINSITYDYNGNFYVCGGSTAANGTGMIAKMTNLDFSDAVITEISQLGHANDITYYDGYLYVCTANNGGVAEGNAPLNQIWRINAADFTDKTLISNCPTNTIGIAYRQGDFWILAPYQIYRTTDFTTYEVIVDNTNTLMNSYGIPTEGRLSQTLFRAAGYLMGWCCAFVHDGQHYGAITYFASTGQPVDFDMFPTIGAEFQGAVYTDMSIWMVTDGNMVNILRADPRHLYYTMLDGNDLDRLTGSGTYYSTGASVSAGLVNSPIMNEGFTLTVDRLGLYNVQQTIDSNSGRHLTRRLSFNHWTWSAWEDMAAEISEIKEELPDLESTVDWTSFATITIPLGWRVGYYSASTGSFSNNAHGISSGVPVYIPDDNVREFTIKAPDGYGVSVYKYNENGYVERYGSIGSTSAQGPNSVTVTPEAGHYYRFAIGYFSGATAGDYLTAEFINGIILTEKRRISNDVKKKHLNICIFGNSYSADSWAFVPFILKKYGITCNIYFYYRGSGSVDRLVEEWTDSSSSGLDDFGISHIRSFVHIDTRRELSWENDQRGVASAKDVVEIANSNANFDTWDLIVVNTGSRSQSFTTAPGNGDPRKGAEPYIRQLINLINESYTRPYKLAWFENYTSFDGYPGNPDLGYPAISPEDMDNRVGVLKSTETIMMAEPFDMVIPAGAAVFNARTNASLASTTLSTTGNLWCADKVHLQAGIPNYIANCAVVQSIFNQFYPHLSILGDNTRITDALITQYKCPFIRSWCGSVMDSTELLYELGQKAAFMACKYPYDITPIYLPTDDTALAWFDSHSDRYWADALITRPEGT